VLHPLTEPDPHYFIRGGQLHPDGRRLLYGANFDAATGAEIEPTWIYSHDLVSGERQPLARPQLGGTGAPRLSPDGAWIVYARADAHPAGRQIWLVATAGGEDRELFNFGPEIKVSASWFSDSQRLVVLADTPTHRRVGVWEMVGGTLHWLVDDPARNLEHAYVPSGSDQIVLVEAQQATLRCGLLDPDSGHERSLPTVPGNLLPLAPTNDGAWIGQYSRSTQPDDLVKFALDDHGDERFVSLTRVWERTPLSAADLAPAASISWSSTDGLEIQGWLYRPRGAARGTIVFVHGGPTSHSSDAVNPEIQYLVRLGFTVLDPNYRGSTGLSQTFREAIKTQGWGGAEQDDIRTGIESLLAAGIAQAGKVGITGTSYGGYSSWCAITRFPPETIAAAAPICGMTDLVVDYETTRPDLRPYSEEMLGGRPDQIPARYHERSPIHFVRHIRGRLLIVQGLRDPNVTPANVIAVEAALRQANVPFELLTFADEGHGISRPANLKTLYQRLAAFFAQAFTASAPPSS
jgi:dienelactone hydrolase